MVSRERATEVRAELDEVVRRMILRIEWELSGLGDATIGDREFQKIHSVVSKLQFALLLRIFSYSSSESCFEKTRIL